MRVLPCLDGVLLVEVAAPAPIESTSIGSSNRISRSSSSSKRKLCTEPLVIIPCDLAGSAAISTARIAPPWLTTMSDSPGCAAASSRSAGTTRAITSARDSWPGTSDRFG